MATLPRYLKPQVFLIEEGQPHDWSFEVFELFYCLGHALRKPAHSSIWTNKPSGPELERQRAPA